MRDEDDKGQHFWHDSCSRGSRVSPTKVSPFQARLKLRFLGEQQTENTFFLCGDFFLKKLSLSRDKKERERVGVCRSDDASDSEERFDGRMSRSRVVVLQKKKKKRVGRAVSSSSRRKILCSSRNRKR